MGTLIFSKSNSFSVAQCFYWSRSAVAITRVTFPDGFWGSNTGEPSAGINWKICSPEHGPSAQEDVRCSVWSWEKHSMTGTSQTNFWADIKTIVTHTHTQTTHTHRPDTHKHTQTKHTHTHTHTYRLDTHTHTQTKHTQAHRDQTHTHSHTDMTHARTHRPNKHMHTQTKHTNALTHRADTHTHTQTKHTHALTHRPDTQRRWKKPEGTEQVYFPGKLYL